VNDSGDDDAVEAIGCAAIEPCTGYYTADDTPDTLDWRRMAQVVTGVYAAVRDMPGR